MSDPNVLTPTSLTQGHSATALTLVVLLLIPCVLVLLLLNCFFLAYKLLALSKESRRSLGATEEMLLERVRASDGTSSTRRPFISLSEPVLPLPVTSSRFLTPDGATGSWPLRAPSSIPPDFRSSFCAARVTSPAKPASGLLDAGWCRSAATLVRSSDSEVETRVNLVPPNSPTDTQHVGLMRRSSTFNMLTDVNPDVAVCEFDKVVTEYNDPPSQTSCLSTSAVGPGLDSDFGASAGVSLRILSADSDGLSSGVLSSALEWDYYDPCYVRQNNVPKHQHNRPALHTKQYWV